MSGCLCDQCAALCCRYFALPIDNPETRRDYDNIRWYLLHENVVIFVEGGQWFIGILNKCRALQPDNLCGIYHTRPTICRGYSTDNCDYHAGDYGYEHLFTSADALWTYARQKLLDERRERNQRPRKRHPAGSKRAARARQISASGTLPLAGIQAPAPVAPPLPGNRVALPILRS